ncbi:hypothetical protein EUGRSUZ_L00060 [Eucalyptus grandis]|uniref:Uncharacterized protein n=1 Tax=Eucalyptus grandis TaxID=71139 RepID=A0A058ZYA6_EUCGR|nr:hypothetical protein EUGRSUZ_L00060 [Eucalyptus grandis]
MLLPIINKFHLVKSPLARSKKDKRKKSPPGCPAKINKCISKATSSLYFLAEFSIRSTKSIHFILLRLHDNTLSK